MRGRTILSLEDYSADEIAYLNHDLDDGVNAGILDLEQLSAFPLWLEAREAAQSEASQSGSIARSSGTRRTMRS